MHWYVNPLHQNVLEQFIYILDGSLSHSDVVPGHNHVIVIWYVPSCYSDSASKTHIHGFYEVRMHWYVNPLHRNLLKHFIYILYGSLSHSDMVPGYNQHVIVIWYVPSCYSDSASSAHIHGFCEVRMHWYVNPLHQNVLKHLIYILDGSLSHSDVVPGHNHVIVICYVPSCYSDSASSAHIHGFYEVRMHWYVYPLHWNVLITLYIY
jgi:branched-subunit amino acid transport protein AzlD